MYVCVLASIYYPVGPTERRNNSVLFKGKYDVYKIEISMKDIQTSPMFLSNI